MTFDSAWSVAEKIPGWFAQTEGALLYRLAAEAPADRCIVEVGSYRGRSAALLAATGRKTYLIDPLKLGDHIDGRTVDADDVAGLTRFVRERDNVVWWNQTSDGCPDPAEPVGLLHVDGCHVGTWPMADFKRFSRLIPPGAYVVFHDVDDAPSVRRTVDDLVSCGVLAFLERAGGLAAYLMEQAGTP